MAIYLRFLKLPGNADLYFQNERMMGTWADAMVLGNVHSAFDELAVKHDHGEFSGRRQLLMVSTPVPHISLLD